MKKGIKSAVLCILALSAMTASGTVFAKNEDTAVSEAEENAEKSTASTTAKAKETVEKINCDTAYITEYLEKKGSIDGYDVYFKAKDFGNDIWEKNGGKPAKKADYTDRQKALDDAINELKRLGDYTIIDTHTKEVAATFKDNSKTDSGKMYVSDAQRFLLITDENSGKPKQLLKIISSVDDNCIYRTADGKSVILTDDKHKKIVGTYKDKGTDGEYRKFQGENGFVWTSPDVKHTVGAFRYGAENDDYRMLVSDRYGGFGLENKKTGYIWWSSPLEASRDSIATPVLADELRSSNVLRYGIPEKQNNNNILRSATSDCEISVKDIKNGIRVSYNYRSAGISFPVEYTLENDYVKASLKVADIKESKPENIATQVTLLSSFGAGGLEDEGYFIVPDGSGAVIRFNNNRSLQPNLYQQRVYGGDSAAVPTNRGAVTEQIYLPVYGIVRDDNAMLVVAAKGNTNAVLNANVSRQSNSSYNLCNFTFILRDTDDYYMAGTSNERFTVFESGAIKSDDIELRYYPISEKGADYTDVAARYRQYLIEEAGVQKRATNDDNSLYIGLYGGTMKKKPIFGIPVNMRTKVTDYSQAQTILSQLREKGVEDMTVSYSRWTNDGIRGKVDTDAKPSGKLGGKSGFRQLSDFINEGGRLYPVSDNRCFYSGNGYNTISGTTVRISGAYSRIVSYDMAYGIPNGFRKNKSLLSPSYFGQVFSDISANYSAAGIEGVSLGDMTSALYGDYGKKNISRGMSAQMLKEGLAKTDDALENGILANTANAYVLPYVSRISNVPMSSGGFDIFDEDIPFYQMVMHGLIPMSTRAVNGSAEPEKLVLEAAVTGCSLNFDMIYEEPSELKDTELDTLYYADHRWWTDTAADLYKLLSPIISDVSGSCITSYQKDGNIITAEYDSGTVIKADLANYTIEHNGRLYQLDMEGGIRY